MHILIAMAALATAEFCSEPIEGGPGEPQFCRFEHETTIYTPFFSVDVHPALLAGVDQSGRRLVARASPPQNPVVVTILASESRVWSGCRAEESDIVIDSMAWSLCDESTEARVQRKLTAQGSDGYLNIFYSYSEPGTAFAQLIDRMLRSIRLQP